jgi:hypothetical protein
MAAEVIVLVIVKYSKANVEKHCYVITTGIFSVENSTEISAFVVHTKLLLFTDLVQLNLNIKLSSPMQRI